MKRLARLLLVAWLAAFTPAALASTTLKVSITSISGKSLFLDKGRTAGIVPDLHVRFFPSGSTPVEGVVVDVSATSARVELLGGSMPPVGTAGELEVPDAVPPTTRPAPSTRPTTIPAHAPWERKDGQRTSDMPLLAPAFYTRPSERPATIHGRVFTNLQLSVDQGGDRDNAYMLSQTGTAFTITNPFGQGGELAFNGEYDYRNADVGSNGNDESDPIINLLSYTIGTEAYSPYRLQLGRFTSYYLPEIGLVDGVEATLRTEGGLSIGGGGGGYPFPLPGQSVGDEDLGFHAFIDYTVQGPSHFNGTLGYQQTWHDGEAGGNVVVGHTSAWLTPKLWVYGSAIVDIYTSDDPAHSSGAELTNAWAQTRYTPDSRKGASLSYSHNTWADVRMQTSDPPADPLSLITDGQVERFEAAVWRDIVKNLRPTLRGNYFTDDLADGYGGELSLDWTNIASHPLALHGAVFYAEGDFTEEWGMRAQATLYKGASDFFLGYEFVEYSSPDTLTDSGHYISQTARGGVGWQIGDWYLNVTADYLFGDSQSGYSLGSYLEYRF
jgi:hypothetical protein